MMLTDNTIFLMLPHAVRTVKAKQPQLMFPLHGPFISPKTTHYISPFFVTFLLETLIIHNAFSNPILLLALLAPFVKKQDETAKHVFFGTILGGRKYVLDTPL